MTLLIQTLAAQVKSEVVWDTDSFPGKLSGLSGPPILVPAPTLREGVGF